MPQSWILILAIFHVATAYSAKTLDSLLPGDELQFRELRMINEGFILSTALVANGEEVDASCRIEAHARYDLSYLFELDVINEVIRLKRQNYSNAFSTRRAGNTEVTNRYQSQKSVRLLLKDPGIKEVICSGSYNNSSDTNMRSKRRSYRGILRNGEY